MGRLLAFGFRQLRRHPLSVLITSGVPVALTFVIILSQAPWQSEISPVDLWRGLSPLQKFLVLSTVSLMTWIPFALNQAVLAIVINAEQDDQILATKELVARAFHPMLVLALGFYFVSFLSMFLLPTIFIGLLLGFVPVIRTLEGPQKKISIGSIKLFGKHFGVVTGLWILIPVVTITIWATGLFGFLLKLNFPYRPILSITWFMLLTVISQTVLNGALIRLYFDEHRAQDAVIEA